MENRPTRERWRDPFASGQASKTGDRSARPSALREPGSTWANRSLTLAVPSPTPTPTPTPTPNPNPNSYCSAPGSTESSSSSSRSLARFTVSPTMYSGLLFTSS